MSFRDFSHSPRRPPTPKRLTCKLPQYAHIYNTISNRALGFIKQKIGQQDRLVSTLYTSFDAVCYNRSNQVTNDYCGGIFNLEFSLDGKLLVAACEGKQVVLYDSGNQRYLKSIENAHHSCVNCIKFLDDKTFATGSDDSLVKLWDIRNLKQCKTTLQGHTSWVKNIEWSEQEQVMVTSAFDGTVYAWNLNEHLENNRLFEKVFLMSGLMRTKLTPDGTKMIISTTTGFIIIIHNLNLLSLARDLRSFRPTLYRLMQTSDQSFPVATTYNYLFHPSRKRNRIEFIDDFPNEAEIISSLQIHPHGWSAVSRNLNGDENQEWTAVHDIQDRDEKDYEGSFVIIDENSDVSEGTRETPNNVNSNNEEPLVNPRPTDLWMGCIPLDNMHESWEQNRQEMSIIHSGLLGVDAYVNPYFQRYPDEKNKVIKNLRRMTHYIEEKNVGKGYIKGLSFSSDGRIIASPFENGVRLLGFSETCQEISECVPNTPKELKTIVEMNNYHRDIVVSCRFNPQHYQLVTGCLGSDIKWYQPVL